MKKRALNVAADCPSLCPSHQTSSQAVPQKLDETDKDDHNDEDDADADGPVRLVQSIFCSFLLSL